MAGLCWMAVVLALSMSAGNSFAVQVDWIRNIATNILDRYREPGRQVSLAVNIPVDQNRVGNVLNTDRPAYVLTTYVGGDVYKGTYVVAALPKEKTTRSGKPYTEHAEARVLDYMNPLVQRSANHILVFYSYRSPCGNKCTNRGDRYNILDKINRFQNPQWTDRAFVFSEVYDNLVGPSLEEMQNAFKNLGTSGINSNYIFRCYFRGTAQIRCIQCYNNGVLSNECVS